MTVLELSLRVVWRLRSLRNVYTNPRRFLIILGRLCWASHACVSLYGVPPFLFRIFVLLPWKGFQEKWVKIIMHINVYKWWQRCAFLASKFCYVALRVYRKFWVTFFIEKNPTNWKFSYFACCSCASSLFAFAVCRAWILSCCINIFQFT